MSLRSKQKEGLKWARKIGEFTGTRAIPIPVQFDHRSDHQIGSHNGTARSTPVPWIPQLRRQLQPDSNTARGTFLTAQLAQGWLRPAESE